MFLFPKIFKTILRPAHGLMLTIILSSAYAAPTAEIPVLTGDNLSLAATHLDANFDWKKRSLEYFKSFEAHRYASTMHDAALTEAARKQSETKLRKFAQDRVNKVMKLTRLVPIESITVNPDAPGKFVIRMLPGVGATGEFADSSMGKRGFAEDSYLLLFANRSLGDRFEVSKTVGEKLKIQFESKQIWGLRLEATMEAVRISQASNVHAVLRRVQWFEEKGSEPLATLEEKAKSEDLIAKRLTSEGYTLQIPLDHEGNYGTHRLNEYLIDDGIGECLELPRERGHRAFSCTVYNANSVNGKTRVKYVGGRGVIVELFMSKDGAPKDEAQLVSFLTSNYKMSHEAVKTWKWWQAQAEVIVSKQDALKPDGTKPYLIATSRDYKKMLAGAKEYGVVK
jgi:hypothetical protein